MFLYLIEGENRHCSYFFAVKADLFLIFPFSEAGHALNLFLFFERFEPQRSYKHGFYEKKRVQHLIWKRRKESLFPGPFPLRNSFE